MRHVVIRASSLPVVLVLYTQVSVIRNSAPKKRYMHGHLISSIFLDLNLMGIPVKKR